MFIVAYYLIKWSDRQTHTHAHRPACTGRVEANGDSIKNSKTNNNSSKKKHVSGQWVEQVCAWLSRFENVAIHPFMLSNKA